MLSCPFPAAGRRVTCPRVSARLVMLRPRLPSICPNTAEQSAGSAERLVFTSDWCTLMGIVGLTSLWRKLPTTSSICLMTSGWAAAVRLCGAYGPSWSRLSRCIVGLANQAVTKCRQRTQNEATGHRGRIGDPLYGIRKLLLTGAERLDARGHMRLQSALDQSDPHDEVADCRDG